MTGRALAVAALAALLAAPSRAQEVDQGPLVERLDLRDTTVAEGCRLVAEVAGLNLVTTPAAGEKKVSLYLQRIPVRRAVEAMCKVSGLWYREEHGILRVMTAEEYRADLVVQRDAAIEVFDLLQPNGASIVQAIRDIYGERVQVSYGVADQFMLSSLLGNTSQGANGQGGFQGSGTNLFSSSFGGNQQNLFPQGTTTSTTTRAAEQESTQVARDLTADQASRLRVDQGGKVTAGAEGLTIQEPPITVSLNRRHNSIVVRTSDQEAMRQIKALVVELDRPTPQVLLEVKVLEVTLEDGRSTALDVDWVEDPVRQNLPTGKPANPLLAGAATGLENVAGLGNFPVAGGTLVYQYLNEHVRVRIQALENEGRLAVLATPLLLCANNEAARVFIGEERPLVRSFTLQTTTTNGVVTNNLVPEIDLRDIGNSLRFVPLINADRTVSLTIVQDISSVNVGGARIPVPSGNGVTVLDIDTVSTTNLQGSVVAKDGLTLAVGGLVRKELSDRQTGIPYLMDLPLIGWMFGSTVRSEVQREIVLLITPHVISTPAEGAERTRQRMEALSVHPYHDLGDVALQRYGRDDVPGSADYRLLVEDYIVGAPEPIR